MKKIKLGAICVACTVLACGAVSLFGCGAQDPNAGTQVSDEEWEERLNITVEQYNSFTCTSKLYSSYSKEQAEEYGEWYSFTTTYQVDNKNQLIKLSSDDCVYNRETNDFTESNSTCYSILDGAGYYDYYPDYKENCVRETTKADFINKIETITKSVSLLSVYKDPIMKYAFTYNNETGAYDIGYTESGISIKFLNNGGMTLTMDSTSICRSERTITGINSTVVVVPTTAYQEISEYKLNKN